MGRRRRRKKKAGGAAAATGTPATAAAAKAAASDPLANYEPVPLAAEDERRKGNKQYHRKNYAAAVYHYTRSISGAAKNPSFLGVLFANRAAAHIGLKHYQACVDDCTAALSLDPKSVKAHGRRAYALYSLKRYADAVADYEAVLKLDPDNVQVRDNLECALRQLDLASKRDVAGGLSAKAKGGGGKRTRTPSGGSKRDHDRPPLPPLERIPLASCSTSVYALACLEAAAPDPETLIYPIALDAAAAAGASHSLAADAKASPAVLDWMASSLYALHYPYGPMSGGNVGAAPAPAEELVPVPAASTGRGAGGDGALPRPGRERTLSGGAETSRSRRRGRNKRRSSTGSSAKADGDGGDGNDGSGGDGGGGDDGPRASVLVPVSDANVARAMAIKVEGNSRFAVGDLDAALEHYTRAIEINPNEGVFYSNRAQVHLKQESYYDAIHDCAKSIERGPTFKAYLRRAKAWHALRAFEEASRDYVTALRYGARYSDVRPGLEQCLYEIEMGFFETYAMNTGVDTTLVQLIHYVQSKMSGMAYDVGAIDKHDIERLASCVYSICEVAAEFPFWDYEDETAVPVAAEAPAPAGEDSPWTLSTFLKMALDSELSAGLDLSSWEQNPRLVAIMDDYIRRGVIIDDRTQAKDGTAGRPSNAAAPEASTAAAAPPRISAAASAALGAALLGANRGLNSGEIPLSSDDIQAFVSLLTESAMCAAFSVVADFLEVAIPDASDDSQFLALVNETSHFQADEPLRVAFQAAQTMLKMKGGGEALAPEAIVSKLNKVLVAQPPPAMLEANYVRALVYLVRAHAKGPVPDVSDLRLAAECEPESAFVQGLILAAQKQAELRDIRPDRR
ncbi:mitochondrial import receptor subunit TOM34 [Thecamonas trahens ATCC 50062]|uniref:Mitochondrial import receptor subunit TOM34 n=1 Tax=Thecamonas trahens ATCC 50062 TaxID=461836 RepID=A0A0L0DTH3_THETB|nr:mitochondrial import receptor subunit TOM34 [Thecamonas trahens ATCC 50062]KNC55619.1 mitochondrial import receptor subunit TOM34 [Thecamonas trahens ATCC 50062]|eukprot:XP_013761392.1 mitochondrial import receptor subunit TOM34 [Thecamonas trahens ATCC 50062]